MINANSDYNCVVHIGGGLFVCAQLRISRADAGTESK